MGIYPSPIPLESVLVELAESFHCLEGVSYWEPDFLLGTGNGAP